MTAADEKKHCGHERMCWKVRQSMERFSCKDTYCSQCKDDTRGPLPNQNRAISEHIAKIKKCSQEMRYLSDDEIILRCLVAMSAIFAANNERRKEPGVFFDE